jgi:hypothetical protein
MTNTNRNVGPDFTHYPIRLTLSSCLLLPFNPCRNRTELMVIFTLLNLQQHYACWVLGWVTAPGTWNGWLHNFSWSTLPNGPDRTSVSPQPHLSALFLRHGPIYTQKLCAPYALLMCLYETAEYITQWRNNFLWKGEITVTILCVFVFMRTASVV